jgi:hypothetical protein
MTEVVAEKPFMGEERPAKGGSFLAGRLRRRGSRQDAKNADHARSGHLAENAR